MVSSSPPDDDSYSSPSEAPSEAPPEAPSEATSKDSARGRGSLLQELRRDILSWLPSGRVTDLSSMVSRVSPGLKGGLVEG